MGIKDFITVEPVKIFRFGIDVHAKEVLTSKLSEKLERTSPEDSLIPSSVNSEQPPFVFSKDFKQYILDRLGHNCKGEDIIDEILGVIADEDLMVYGRNRKWFLTSLEIIDIESREDYHTRRLIEKLPDTKILFRDQFVLLKGKNINGSI